MSIAADFIASLQQFKTEPDILMGLVKATGRLLNANVVDAQLHQESSLHLVAQAGWPSDALKYVLVLPMDANTVCARAGRFQRSVFVSDTLEDEDFKPYREISEHVGFRSVYSIPLMAKGKLLGVSSTLFREPNGLHFEKKRAVEVLSQFAADAIEQLQSLRVR